MLDARTDGIRLESRAQRRRLASTVLHHFGSREASGSGGDRSAQALEADL
jgi:hypothetical protein